VFARCSCVALNSMNCTCISSNHCQARNCLSNCIEICVSGVENGQDLVKSFYYFPTSAQISLRICLCLCMPVISECVCVCVCVSIVYIIVHYYVSGIL